MSETRRRTPKVLIIARDPTLGAALAEQLEHGDGHSVTRHASLAAAAADPGALDRDVVLLADPAPDEALEAWRPIVALTTDAEGVAGADVTITRPVRVADLVAAILRAMEAGRERFVAVGGLRFERGAKLLVDPVAGTQVRLTEKEAAILALLRGSPGAAVTRERLLEEVWGYDPGVTTHTLESHVYRLRRKLAPFGRAAPVVASDAGGYRLADRSET